MNSSGEPLTTLCIYIDTKKGCEKTSGSRRIENTSGSRRIENTSARRRIENTSARQYLYTTTRRLLVYGPKLLVYFAALSEDV